VSGKQHQKRLSRQNQEGVTYTCDLCGVSSIDERSYKVHMAGKRHKEKLELLESGGVKKEADGTDSENKAVAAPVTDCKPCQASCLIDFTMK
jgi:hypothetical protein